MQVITMASLAASIGPSVGSSNPIMESASTAGPSNPINAAAQIGELRHDVDNRLWTILNGPGTSNFQDQTSKNLRNWQKLFHDALRTNDEPQDIKRHFIEMLAEDILYDPIRSSGILDEESHLGSDGLTYGEMSLFIYLSPLPTACYFRSPSNPADPTPFTTQPHPLVRNMVKWLKNQDAETIAYLKDEKNIDVHNTAIKRMYTRLDAERKLPPYLPTEESLMAFCVTDAIQRGVAAVSAAANAFQTEVEQSAAAIHARVSAHFAALDQSFRQLGVDNNARLEAFEQRRREALDRLHGRIDELNQDLEVLEEVGQALQQDMAITNERVSDGFEADAEIKKAVNEFEKALKKQKRNQWKQIAMTVAITAACVFATWGACALLELGAEATLSTTAMAGGASLNLRLGEQKGGKRKSRDKPGNP